MRQSDIQASAEKSILSNGYPAFLLQERAKPKRLRQAQKATTRPNINEILYTPNPEILLALSNFYSWLAIEAD